MELVHLGRIFWLHFGGWIQDQDWRKGKANEEAAKIIVKPGPRMEKNGEI